MKTFHIYKPSEELREWLMQKNAEKTKPPGALGMLEEVAIQIGIIQNTIEPVLRKPHLLVFAGDHGIAAEENISAYPQAVTHQMVLNFLSGGAAINVFCNQHQIALEIVDAGVNHNFVNQEKLLNRKVGMGTKNFLVEPAMSSEEVETCINNGAALIKELVKKGCNIVGLGEMGIGNTSAAGIIMSCVCKKPLEQCVGKGTGLNERQYLSKIEILKKAMKQNGIPSAPLEILRIYGGFEIAQMCGAMLQAAELKMIILVDGFIATAAFLIAFQLYPTIIHYALFTHQSDEQGHAGMLAYLKKKALLNLGLRLGEGTGAALAFPVIQSAVNYFNQMASFKEAGVSEKPLQLS